MPLDIFIHMHGSWSPEDGYAFVPKGCRVTFWSPFAKLMHKTMVEALLEDKWTGKAERVVTEYKAVPNMKLSPLTPAQLAGDKLKYSTKPGRVYVSTNKASSLDLTMKDLRTEHASEELNFHWLCCQELELKLAGGRTLGVNSGDFRHLGFYMLMWTDEQGVFKWKRVAIAPNPRK